jgi:MFS superfamily sulfate permease-like transporter
MAVVASLETLLCVEATDKLDPQKRVTPTNRELKAQGVGNIVSGLLGGLPVTQVIVRSSANIQAGGRTKVAAIVHGILLMVSVFALPTVLNLIPLAGLAAVLLIVGYKLAKPALFIKMYRDGPIQFIPFAVTVAGIVFIDLLIGLGLGLGVALLSLLVENYRLPFQMDLLPGDAKRVRISLAQHVTFLNKASIVSTLDAIPDGSKVVIDASQSTFVHADVVEIIDDFVQGVESRNIEVKVEGLDHHQKGQPSSGIKVSARPLTNPGIEE